MEIDAEQFIAVKGFKAKGKRICTWNIQQIEELEPQRFPEPEEAAEEPEEEEPEVEDVHIEESGQLSLFPDEE